MGEKVWATGGELGTRRDGFQAEYTVLPTAGVQVRPSRLTAVEAASVGVAFTAAWYGLVEGASVHLGDRVVVTGGAGAVGSAVVQLARWSGVVQVTAVVRDDAEVATARHFGATACVKDAGELVDLDESVRPTLCFDTVGGPVLPDVVKAMARGGRIVNLSATGDGQVTFDLDQFYRSRLSLHGFGTGTSDVVQNARVLALLRPGFDNGQLQPPQIAATFPLSKAADAYAAMEQHPQGKVVLTMGVPR